MATIVVGNLAHDVTEGDLREVFEPYGRIRSIRLLTRRGMAFIEVKQSETAEAAVEALRGTALKGRTLDVGIQQQSGGGRRGGFRRRR